MAAAYVLSVLNVDHDNETNNGANYVSDEITNNVASMSINNGGVKGYAAIYNNADGGLGGYGMFNGVYAGPHSEGYTNPY